MPSIILIIAAMLARSMNDSRSLRKAVKSREVASSGRENNRFSNRATATLQCQDCFARGVASSQDYVDIEHAKPGCTGRLFIVEVEMLRTRKRTA